MAKQFIVLIGIFISVTVYLTKAYAVTTTASQSALEGAEQVEAILAIINDKPLLLSEFNTAWQEFKLNLGNSTDNTRQLQQRLLEQLITVRLQVDEADKRGIRINDRQLNDQIKQIANNNRLSVSQLFEQLQQRGVEATQFRQNIAQQMVIQRLQQTLFANGLNIDEREVERLYNRELNRNDPNEYQFRILLIEKNKQRNDQQLQQLTQKLLSELRQGLNFIEAMSLYSDIPSNPNAALPWLDATSIPDDFHDFLKQANQGDFSDVIQTQRGNFVIQLAHKRSKQPLLSTRYKIQLITLPKRIYERQAALDTYQLIVNAEDSKNSIATLAKELSQDRYAFKNGISDWLSTADLPSPLAQQIDNLPLQQPELVSTAQSWLIFQLLAKESFDARETVVKNQIRQNLMNKQIQQRYSEYLKNLRNNTPIKILASF